MYSFVPHHISNHALIQKLIIPDCSYLTISGGKISFIPGTCTSAAAAPIDVPDFFVAPVRPSAHFDFYALSASLAREPCYGVPDCSWLAAAAQFKAAEPP
jgi:hypothetical protein